MNIKASSYCSALNGKSVPPTPPLSPSPQSVQWRDGIGGGETERMWNPKAGEEEAGKCYFLDMMWLLHPGTHSSSRLLAKDLHKPGSVGVRLLGSEESLGRKVLKAH